MNRQEQETRRKSPVQVRNRKAQFEYAFLDTLTAGIALTGTEIKSIRGGKASLVDSYCAIERGEVWVRNMYVAPYFYGGLANPSTRRDRKLLLRKREITRLQEAVRTPGLTIVPILLFIDEHGRAKVDIALARGKRLYDKRQSLREKEDRREMDRASKMNRAI